MLHCDKSDIHRRLILQLPRISDHSFSPEWARGYVKPLLGPKLGAPIALYLDYYVPTCHLPRGRAEANTSWLSDGYTYQATR